eukprot:7328021-Prymnesium_polylepis.1
MAPGGRMLGCWMSGFGRKLPRASGEVDRVSGMYSAGDTRVGALAVDPYHLTSPQRSSPDPRPPRIGLWLRKGAEQDRRDRTQPLTPAIRVGPGRCCTAAASQVRRTEHTHPARRSSALEI